MMHAQDSLLYVNGSRRETEATWANLRSVFNGIRFILAKHIVSIKTQQGMFRVTRNLSSYS